MSKKILALLLVLLLVVVAVSTETALAQRQPRNASPRAVINLAQQGLRGATVMIRCNSTDRDGTITRRVWTVSPAEGVGGLRDQNAALVSAVFPNAGRYYVTLEVTDNRGAVSRARRGINIVENRNPIAGIRGFLHGVTYEVDMTRPITVRCTTTRGTSRIARRQWGLAPMPGYEHIIDSARLTMNEAQTSGRVTFTKPIQVVLGVRVTDEAGNISEFFSILKAKDKAAR